MNNFFIYLRTTGYNTRRKLMDILVCVLITITFGLLYSSTLSLSTQITAGILATFCILSIEFAVESVFYYHYKKKMPEDLDDRF